MATAAQSPKLPTSRPLWHALRRAERPLTARELTEACGARRTAVSIRLSQWVADGAVLRTEERPPSYMLPPRSSVRPPKAAATRAGVRAPSGVERMWSAMRILKRFDLPELAMTADVGHGTAEGYISCLLRAGYLSRSHRGRWKGDWPRYRLIRNTGPRHPRMIRGSRSPNGRVALFDQNTRATIELPGRGWSSDPTEKGGEVNHVR